MLIWVVVREESGMKLNSFLQSKLTADYSLKSIKRALDQGACRINGRPERFATTVLGLGDRVEFFDKVAKEPKVDFWDPKYILWEDEAVLFYNKPCGIVVDSQAFQKSYHAYNSSLELVHRLDKETSGILLFGKGEYAQSLLDQFRQRLVKKEYLAIVDGVPKDSQGLIQNTLGPLKTYQGQTLWGEVATSQGQVAETRWQVEQTGAAIALVRCFPKTGRTHQLRVHLAGIGHPILGDSQYGRKFHSSIHPGRILLHAHQLTIQHPLKKSPLTVKAPLPEDFLKPLQMPKS